MKIYLAGSSDPGQIVRVKHWSAHLAAAGWQVISTWIENIERVGAGSPRHASSRERRGWSATCLTEVRQCDAFWVLVPPPEVATAGAWVELGTAYESARTIVCSGDTRRSIFPALGHEEESDEDAFSWLQAAFEVRARPGKWRR